MTWRALIISPKPKVVTLFVSVCVDGVRNGVSWLVHHRAVGLYPLLLAAAAYTAAAGAYTRSLFSST
jgi:hypothetical protein